MRSTRRRCALPLSLVLVLVLAGQPLPGLGGGVALAAGCVVTTTADAGAGSLREKLADTNCSDITFSLPGSAPWTILLASNLPTLTRTVSVTGPGAASLIIDRNYDINDTSGVIAFTVEAGATFH